MPGPYTSTRKNEKMNIIEITDLNAPELAVYTKLTESQLRNKLEPEKGIFIAESPKVIGTALDAKEPVQIFSAEHFARSQHPWTCSAAPIRDPRTGRLLARIILPTVRPALATAFVFGFITAWNEFLFGLILTTQHAVPMTVGASFFFASGGGGVQWGVAAAVIVVASLPPVILGLAMYKQIGRAMVAGAVKG